MAFRTPFGADIFSQKYAHEGCETWAKLAAVVVEDVCAGILPREECGALVEAIQAFKFLPGGRYLRNAGRDLKFFSNCFALRAEEDTREDWANLSWKVESCLISGGGIGVDYSVYRPEGAALRRTGGVASGPISKMEMTNEIGRRVMQGGSRRSAIYASLNWAHADAGKLLHTKDWESIQVPGTNTTLADVKAADQNWPAPLDYTNVSLNYDDDWLNNPNRAQHPTFLANVRQALRTSEPGFSFNFGSQRRHTLRNACAEMITDEDSDVCNLGSLNLAQIESPQEMWDLCYLAARFLYCGTIRGLVPNEKARRVRDQQRRIGVGLMGVHEWLIQRGHRYEVVPELVPWLVAYRDGTAAGAGSLADSLGLPRPAAYRAIAPTGTIGTLAGTTTGIEPLFASAYMRRYLKNGSEWCYQFVIDAVAKDMVMRYGVDPETIESAMDLAGDVERRLRFQADVQGFVDMGIASTINLPAWGSAENNADRVESYAKLISDYAPRLRGLTFYADGSRGGQPLTRVSYADALRHEGVEIREHDSCKGGICGA